MSEIQIKQGNVIYEKDNALTMVSIIIEGNVTAKLPGETIKLCAGDVIGVLDLYTGVHSCTYVASDDVVVDSYPYKSAENLIKILQEEDDFSRNFVTSTLKQFFAIADICHVNTYTCDSLYSVLMEYHRDYLKLCKQFQIPAKNLPGLEFIQPLLLESKPDAYMNAYYKDVQKMCGDPALKPIFNMHSFITGFLQRSSQDMHQYLNSCSEMDDYMSQLSQLLINESKIDFLDLYMSLLSHAAHKKEDTTPLASAISKMFIRSKNVNSIPDDLYQQRLLEYRAMSQELQELAQKQGEEALSDFHEAEIKLKHSLTVLLQFAGMDDVFSEKFISNVDTYKNIVDKTVVSTEMSALRTSLTRDFFELYKRTFFASLQSTQLPLAVKLFLYFGYVDEDLCGLENAAHLCDILPTYKSAPEHQIYLFYDWLKLIYNGEKQPRRDEFDQDYPAHVQTMVNDGKITKAEAAELLSNNREKVLFELDNMFMTAVKMTYGRLQTYCPLLSEHDFIKTPEECLIIPKKLKGIFQEITSVDFSAYHREIMYADSCLPNGKEIVQREFLPDVILLPNIGIRGALWQEIEGRNRSTPGCMLFPVFCLTDLRQLVIRLTGEFRWEMCKRMQGSRWNDVSNLSLTSEYFDYLQFYKKNKDLSTEAKEKCRQQLARVKNRFREAFILDYIAWITYEAKGTPHMNKVTRKIFMTYCPFSAEYREKLKTNPFYSSMLEKYENQKSKELTRMNSVVYRIQRTGRKVLPPEIEQQLKFLNM